MREIEGEIDKLSAYLKNASGRIKEFDIWSLYIQWEHKIKLLIEEYDALEKRIVSSKDAAIDAGEKVSLIGDGIANLDKNAEIMVSVDTSEIKKEIAAFAESLRDNSPVLHVDTSRTMEGIASVKSALDGISEAARAARALSLDVSQALAATAEAKGAIDAIPDLTTKTVIIRYMTQASPVKPFSEGMGDIEERMGSLPEGSTFTAKFDPSFTNVIDRLAEVQRQIAWIESTSLMDAISRMESLEYYRREKASLEALLREYGGKKAQDGGAASGGEASDYLDGPAGKESGGKLRSARSASLLPDRRRRADDAPIDKGYGMHGFGMTFSPVININGSNKDGKALAREIEVELVDRIRSGRSAIPMAVERRFVN